MSLRLTEEQQGKVSRVEMKIGEVDKTGQPGMIVHGNMLRFYCK
jgi:hypothetical protein